MKRILTLVSFLMVALTGYTQNRVDLTLRYNTSQSRYEVYARPNFSQVNYLWGSSQISVVTPTSVANAPFVITSLAGGSWVDASALYAPVAASGSDFHGISSGGQAVTLQAGQELLLFSFTLPGGGCVSGLRLFTNGTDPGSNALTMPGDFTNAIYAGANNTGAGAYGSNYANTGTVCSNCPPRCYAVSILPE
jgi:hypothetical protein